MLLIVVWFFHFVFSDCKPNNYKFSGECSVHVFCMSLGPVPTIPEKSVNAVLFLRLGLATVHTNPTRKRSFSKTLFKPEEFEDAGFVF